MSTPTREELVARARDLGPVLKERADETEKARTVPTKTIEELTEAGIFRYFQPARFGGWEMDWGVQVDLGREIGKACGSTAWIVSVVGAHSAMVGRFPLEAQEEVWGDDPDVIIATASARTEGETTPVSGGLMVSGRWRFGSGVDHAKWVIVPAPLPQETPGPPELIQVLVPASEITIDDDWFVAGLRGTGSKAIVLDRVFVPTHRTLPFQTFLRGDPEGGRVHDSYIYRVEMAAYFGTSLLGPILGIAEGALADFTEITRTKLGTIFKEKVAESMTVQQRLAESSAEIDAAGLMAERMLDVLHRKGEAGEALTPVERVRAIRDRAWLAKICHEAVFRLVRYMGASGLSDTNPVQRHYRDLSAAVSQIGVNWDRNSTLYGKWALGMPTGDAAIDDARPEPGPSSGAGIE